MSSIVRLPKSSTESEIVLGRVTRRQLMTLYDKEREVVRGPAEMVQRFSSRQVHGCVRWLACRPGELTDAAIRAQPPLQRTT